MHHPLTAAVTAPTGDIGRAFPRALDREPGVERVIGPARRPFDPQVAGLSSRIECRQGDVLESDKLRAVFAGADVVGAPGSPFRAEVEATHYGRRMPARRRQR